MDISDNDESGWFSDFVEVPEETGKRWLAAYKEWAGMLSEIWSAAQSMK